MPLKPRDKTGNKTTVNENVSWTASKYFATHCFFTDHLKHKTV